MIKFGPGNRVTTFVSRKTGSTPQEFMAKIQTWLDNPDEGFTRRTTYDPATATMDEPSFAAIVTERINPLPE